MDWRDILTKVAPTVASAIAGPLGGAAVSAIGGILGISEPTQVKIKEAIESGSMTGEHIAAIKMLEMKLKSEEEERGFRYAELEFKDKDSARQRDAEFMKAGTRNYRADFLVAAAIIAVLILTAAIWQDPTINEYMKGTVTLVLGRFLGYIDQIYSFEFGSTRQGQRKTELLAKADPIK